VESGASIVARGGESFVEFVHDHVGNSGTVNAESRGQVTFDCATVSNDGTIEAQCGGIVDVTHSTITQSCEGIIFAAGEGSLVNLDHATMSGGTLGTHWGGLIQTVGGNSTFDGLTIACGSEIQVSDNTSLTLEHTIDNKGTITLGGQPIGDDQNNGGGDPNLVINGCVTLKGHGDIVLSEREGLPNQDFVNSYSGGTLDNVNNTISGAGTIGDCHLTLINESCGVINANGAAGNPLIVDTSYNEIVNKGLMEATHGGELDVNSD